LYSLFWLLLPTLCRCRELLLYLIILSDPHTHTHSVGILEIGLSQKFLPDHTKHSQPIPGHMYLAGFETAIPGSELPLACTLDCAANAIGVIVYRDLSPIEA
jgi:hypothetical protein